MTRSQQDQQSRVFSELSVLVLKLLRSPTPLSFSDHPPVVPIRPPPSQSSRPSPADTQARISPAGFASLLLGISLALMLCGSVTFFIGFMLMPWVLGLVTVLYVAGFVSSLSVLGRSILCYATTPRKDIPGVLGSRLEGGAWGTRGKLVKLQKAFSFFKEIGRKLFYL